MNLQDFPFEILEIIINYLPYNDVQKLFIINKYFNNLLQNVYFDKIINYRKIQSLLAVRSA